MIKKIDHIVITTAQPDNCLAFYEKLGFTSKKAGERYELHVGDFKINVHVKGRELSPHAGNVQTGCSDLCFEINGPLTSFADSLKEKDLAIELGIVTRTGVNGTMHSVYLRDPDGTLIEFCSYE